MRFFIKSITFVLLGMANLDCGELAAKNYDLVIHGGQVMDPASGLNAKMNLGIDGGKVVVIAREALQGDVEIDANGLVVAPGFIDLHAHGQREFEAQLQAQDGVTTQLEMEIGVFPVDAWYASRAGKNPINYGATVSHVRARQSTMTDLAALGLTDLDLVDGLGSGSFAILAQQRDWVEANATPEDLAGIQKRIQQGLDEGALGVGYGINYTAGATREEILAMFQLAQANGVTNFVHSRYMSELDSGGSVDAIQELVADAAISGASLHIVHIGSSGGRRVPLILDMLDNARANGMDITTEVYPYTAWSTFIGAAIFDGNFTEMLGLGYADIELPATGERLNEEQFYRIRSERPETIIVGHAMDEANVTAAVAHPGVMIASDGMFYIDGRAHPRGAGTFSRVLGYYVREKQALDLMTALGKMSYLPASRLENVVPQMKRKGRIIMGSDADIVVFDPATVADLATFEEPARPSTGIVHVIVNGVSVVRDGQLLEGVNAGQPVRR
ncbi:MAG TPA: amidohydrolase family protein [Xanthomonadales bacterium]|nr:amidohydrolase family protein [Xanthomonadales bacterium]